MRLAQGSGTVGVFNALGPARRIAMKEVLEACNAAAGNRATLTWVDAAFLDKHTRAIATGLEFRPILDTARDTLAWLPSVHEDKRRQFSSTGISREKEAKVLAAWKARG
jgi:2'-hydroxyisoflavone reductase